MCMHLDVEAGIQVAEGDRLGRRQHRGGFLGQMGDDGAPHSSILHPICQQ